MHCNSLSARVSAAAVIFTAAAVSSQRSRSDEQPSRSFNFISCELAIEFKKARAACDRECSNTKIKFLCVTRNERERNNGKCARAEKEAISDAWRDLGVQSAG